MSTMISRQLTHEWWMEF